MATTDESAPSAGSGGDTPPGSPPAWQKALRRYGPIAAIVVLIAGAVVVFGGGGGGDDDDAATGDTEVGTEQELIESGPMTPAKADLRGEDVDFGPNCDSELGRIKLVSVYAPPCVEPFTGDNGGGTSPGVTADTVKIVYYRADPRLDPLTAATVQGAGADVDPADRDRDGPGLRRPLQQAVRDLRPDRGGRGLHRHRRR